MNSNFMYKYVTPKTRGRQVEHFDEPLFLRLSALAQLHAPSDLDLVSIANIVNAFARSPFDEPELFAHMSAAVRAAPLTTANSLAVSLIANAFSRVAMRCKLIEHVSLQEQMCVSM
jgi:hypothetical protein